MSDQFLTAIIASGITLIGIMISSIINSRQIKQQESNSRRQLQRMMTQKLYELRLKHYPRAYEITEAIKQERAPKYINDKEQIDIVLKELLTWKNGEVSLALSKNSLYLFGELCKLLEKRPNAKDGNYLKKQAENIFKARVDFRRSLRKDLGFLFDEDLE